MNTIDAFDFTISKVNELLNVGINASITKKEVLKTVANYELPNDLWCNIKFYNLMPSQIMKVNEMANYLGLCGISFDVGGCGNTREWELDWSFNYSKGEEKIQWKDALNDLEEMIGDNPCYATPTGILKDSDWDSAEDQHWDDY